MKKRALLLYLLPLLLSYQGFSQLLSPQSKISLITVGPGEELYSGFGHSAFWIFDPVTGLDRIYNYGTFEFNDDFYVKFVMGKLDYMLSVGSLHHLVENAKEEGRYVIEQELALDQTKKENIFLFLEKNYLPENRYYKYDFFYDNCSSRLRDVLISNIHDELRFQQTGNAELSFRQMIDQYLTDKEIQDLGMDIGLGAPADRKATKMQEMFLPEYLLTYFDHATVRNNGQWEHLVTNKKTLLEATYHPAPAIITPAVFMWIVLGIVLFFTWRNFKYGIGTFFWDATALLIIGLLGAVLVFLWFFTDHSVTQNNWDLIWATPLHLFILPFMRKGNFPGLLKKFFALYAILCFILVAGWKFIPEELNKTILPVLLILIVRSVFLMKYNKDIENGKL